jgi:hypothetical protein
LKSKGEKPIKPSMLKDIDMPSKQNLRLVPVGIFVAILAVSAIFLLNQQYGYVWVMLAITGSIILGSHYRKLNPHKILTLLVASNIFLDIIAIAIWAFVPNTQWSIYQLGFTIVGAEAGVAAAIFVFVLFGLKRKKNWAPLLAIALTVTQRVFATYVFFPSKALLVTLMWSILIIYFAYADMKSKQTFTAI